MLELKTYTPTEIAAVIQTTTERQRITRKLDRYNIVYSCEGRGNALRYIIHSIPNRFKVFCVFDLGIDPHADFRKILNLFYYLFCVDGFAELPIEEMAKCLAETNVPVSRETIGKWLAFLSSIDYVMFDKSDCVYYKITKNGTNKTTTAIDKKTYNTGWATYFEVKKTHGSSQAYAAMYRYLGGHPYKKYLMKPNAFYIEEINRMIDYINEAFIE